MVFYLSNVYKRPYDYKNYRSKTFNMFKDNMAEGWKKNLQHQCRHRMLFLAGF